jgi:hypothetical protein
MSLTPSATSEGGVFPIGLHQSPISVTRPAMSAMASPPNQTGMRACTGVGEQYTSENDAVSEENVDGPPCHSWRHGSTVSSVRCQRRVTAAMVTKATSGSGYSSSEGKNGAFEGSPRLPGCRTTIAIVGSSGGTAKAEHPLSVPGQDGVTLVIGNVKERREN